MSRRLRLVHTSEELATWTKEEREAIRRALVAIGEALTAAHANTEVGINALTFVLVRAAAETDLTCEGLAEHIAKVWAWEHDKHGGAR